MKQMFFVRTLAPTSSREPFPAKAACAVAPAPRPLTSRGPHLPPRRMPTPCDSAVRGRLQSAADPRHVQGHNHGGHVLCAYPRPDNQPRALPCKGACASPPRTTLSPPGARKSPRVVCPHLATRQDVAAFNQPLNLDTSKVTTMESMFYVRTLAPTSSREPFPAKAACAVAPAHRPLTSRPAPPPASYTHTLQLGSPRVPSISS